MTYRGHNRGDQWRAGYIIDSIRALYGMTFGDCYEQQKDSTFSPAIVTYTWEFVTRHCS